MAECEQAIIVATEKSIGLLEPQLDLTYGSGVMEKLQVTWVSYRDSACEAMNQGGQGGTGVDVSIARCEMIMTQDRLSTFQKLANVGYW